MANVLFKQGTEAALATMNSAKTATEGTFYLTKTDDISGLKNRRLYIGIADGTAVPVNEGVLTVPSTDSLPTNLADATLHAGQFYYATKENVLCVFNGKAWVQINPNTNTYIGEVSMEVSVASNVATIKSTLKEYDVTGKATGTNHVLSHKIKGAGGIQVSNSGTEVTLTGDTYTLSNTLEADGKTVKVKLDSANTNNDTSVSFKSGSNVTFTRDTNGVVTVKAEDTKLSGAENGYGASKSDTTTNKEGFYGTVKDTSGATSTVRINPQIKVGETSTSTVKFINGVAELPVYSKTDIDVMWRDLDAVKYMGTLGTGGSTTSLINKTDLRNGYLYLLCSDVTATNGSSATSKPGATIKGKTGDMFIVRGTEDPQTGYIVPSSLQIDLVPSGDDAQIDTTYKVVPITNGFKITASTGDSVGQFEVAGDNTYITVSEKQGSNSNKVTVSHKTITSSDTANNTADSASYTSDQIYGTTITIPVVDKVTRDAAGHVKSVTTRTYRLKDTNGHLEKNATYTAAAATDNQSASITSKVFMKTSDGSDAGTATGTFGISSSSMKVGASGATVTVDLEWGTF